MQNVDDFVINKSADTQYPIDDLLNLIYWTSFDIVQQFLLHPAVSARYCPQASNFG